jgi:transposase
MAKSLSIDLRRRVVDAVEAGSSCRAAAERFGIGVSSAIRWVQRARTRGTLEPDKRGGNQRSHRIDAHRNVILRWIEEEPDLTLMEIADRLDAAVGYRPLPSIVCRFFQRQGITRKKRRRMLPSKNARI